MLEKLEILREYSTLSILARMLLALILGGFIGLERENRRKPAGFRTHILICLGAAITMLTSQYLLLERHMFTDPARLGAQVVSGIGFIGVGTIIITSHRRVRGLTTAAGLWASAIIGLCCGAGYYEGAVVGTVIILISEIFLIKLEYRFANSAQEINIFIEYNGIETINQLIMQLTKADVKILNISVSREKDADISCGILTLELKKKYLEEELMQELGEVDGVTSVRKL